jgi:hypothetical protein
MLAKDRRYGVKVRASPAPLDHQDSRPGESTPALAEPVAGPSAQGSSLSPLTKKGSILNKVSRDVDADYFGACTGEGKSRSTVSAAEIQDAHLQARKYGKEQELQSELVALANRQNKSNGAAP